MLRESLSPEEIHQGMTEARIITDGNGEFFWIQDVEMVNGYVNVKKSRENYEIRMINDEEHRSRERFRNE